MFDLGIVSRLCSRYTVNELSVLAESQTFLLFFSHQSEVLLS